jgi:hypothetical protein
MFAMAATYDDNFFRKRYTTPIAFLVGILLFLLPFVEIKCNDAPFAENTGLGLAFGTDYKITGQIKTMADTFNDHYDNHNGNPSKESGKMYVVALAALVLGVAGLVWSLVKQRDTTAHMVVGILGALFLIILMIQLQYDIRDKSKMTGSEDGVAPTIKVTARFTAWYYLSLISFLTAAFFSYRQRKEGMLPEGHHHDHPPKNAPQLNIENPGEQSEFPTSPDESEMER